MILLVIALAVALAICAYFLLKQRKELVVRRSAVESTEKEISQLLTEKDTLGKANAKITRHNETLVKTLRETREGIKKELSNIDKIVKEHESTIEELKSVNGKLTDDYNKLARQAPGFRPRAIRWSGPGGARALAEEAAKNSTPEGKRQQHENSQLEEKAI